MKRRTLKDNMPFISNGLSVAQFDRNDLSEVLDVPDDPDQLLGCDSQYKTANQILPKYLKAAVPVVQVIPRDAQGFHEAHVGECVRHTSATKEK